VSREQMGAYLCIASNKVPPSVSKRIKLVVECEYYTVHLGFIPAKIRKFIK
jgi:hypothetical protein